MMMAGNGRFLGVLAVSMSCGLSLGSGPGARQEGGVAGGGVGPAAADLVLENARIWSDGLPAFAEFAAVRDGRFVYVGPHDGRYIGPRTQRVDADGRVVIPGLIDAHVHMLGGGQGLSQLQLRDAASREDFIQQIADWTAKLGPGQWVRGRGWSVESWPVPEQPTKEWVDGVTGDHPLYLPRMDGHSALVNSAALRLAGITADGPDDPVGGVIDRHPQTGEPTGILRESAMALVSGLIPRPTVEEQVEALLAASGHALEHGITAVSDIPMIGEIEAYEALAARAAGVRGQGSGVREELTPSPPHVRFYIYPTAGDWAAAAPRVREFRGRPGWVEMRGLKDYVDGSLGSQTAKMREPYLVQREGRSGWRGLFLETVENGQLAQNIGAACAAGLQPIVHAIGDEANHYLLNTYQEKFARGVTCARCRIEHVQHLLPEDIARFAELGVIASMQPFHKADDARYCEALIGPERSKTSYAFKSLLDAGAVVAFGSDWPVVPINPFLEIEAAVTGRTLDDAFWQTQENITVGEALRCYTSRAAYAMFAENEIGRIAPGLRADFVILNASLFDPDPQWGAIRPVAVYVEGREAHRAD